MITSQTLIKRQPMNFIFRSPNDRNKKRFKILQSNLPCKLQIITNFWLYNEEFQNDIKISKFDAYVYFNNYTTRNNKNTTHKQKEISARIILESTKDLVYLGSIISNKMMIPGQLIIGDDILINPQLKRNLILCTSTLLKENIIPIFTFTEQCLYNNKNNTID